jgi:hypothetical protein
MGRPSHEPTERTKKLVQDLASAGFAYERIAKHIGIDSETLAKHYKAELEYVDHALGEIAGRALLIARTGDPKVAIPMMIFILKTRCGWRETDDKDLTDKIISYVIDSKAGKNAWERRDK